MSFEFDGKLGIGDGGIEFHASPESLVFRFRRNMEPLEPDNNDQLEGRAVDRAEPHPEEGLPQAEIQSGAAEQRANLPA